MFSTEFEQASPKLLVFAGPNGSGKSTVTAAIPVVGMYVNADNIKLTSGCSDLEAAQEAECIRNMLLQRKRDFTFETVLSTNRNLELLQKAKQSGYMILAVFVLTKDPKINVARVQHRVKFGGHGVPEDKIINRYYRSLSNLPILARIADQTQVIDNSGDTPELLCEIVRGQICLFESFNWSQEQILNLLSNHN